MVQVSLDRVLLVPTHNPPHKPSPSVTTDHRLEMVRRATRGDDRMEVSAVETKRDGPSYTVDTLRVLRENQPEDEFFLMIGGDELESFTEWHEWEAILRECTLLAMKRPGTDVSSANRDVLEESRVVDVPEVNVSSTLVRERLGQGRPAGYFLPESVRAYVREHDLYRT